MDQDKIISLYGDQVTIKFQEKKHVYYRKFNQKVIVFIDVPDDHEAEVVAPDSEVNVFVKIPSTTTITKKVLDKPQLYNWLVDGAVSEFKRCMQNNIPLSKAESMAKGYRWKVLKQAGGIGTTIHNWIHEFILFQMEMGDEPEPPLDPPEVSNAILGFLDWYVDNVDSPLQTEYLVYHPELDVAGTIDFIFINKDGEVEIVDFKSGNNIYPADIMQIAFYRKAYAIQEGEFPQKSTMLHLQKDSPKAIPMSNINPEASQIAFECGKYLVNWRDSLNI